MVKELLAKRRDRAIATILGTKERELDRYLPSEASQVYRKIVLDQINDFYDLTLDVLKSFDNDAITLNTDYLVKLDEIHEILLRDFEDD